MIAAVVAICICSLSNLGKEGRDKPETAAKPHKPKRSIYDPHKVLFTILTMVIYWVRLFDARAKKTKVLFPFLSSSSDKVQVETPIMPIKGKAVAIK